MWWPPCEHCGHSSRSLFCRHCLKTLNVDRLCLGCGDEPKVSGVYGLRCIKNDFPWISLQASFIWTGGVRSWILNIKNRRMPERWRELEPGYLPPTFPDHLEVIPVPSDPVQVKRRLFDPSLALARHLAKTLSFALAEPLLKRREFLKSQKNLSRAERHYYLQKCIYYQGGRLKGRRLLLVDDVMTTGASLKICAGLLRAAGAEVHVYSVARALASRAPIEDNCRGES